MPTFSLIVSFDSIARTVSMSASRTLASGKSITSLQGPLDF